MIEVAVRVGQLVSSNVNSLVDAASNPEKMLGLLIVEIEEAILTLSREVSQAERRARDLRIEAGRHDTAQADWNEKARFAMSKEREDLARGALAERETSAQAAADARAAADGLDADVTGVRETISALEVRLLESRDRLSASASPAASHSASASSGKSRYSERVLDRIDTITKRVDFAEAGAPQAKAASLDAELASMARDAKVDSELETLRKSLKKKRG